MNSNLLFNFTVDKTNNQIHVQREFAADVELVWQAWTTPEILNQWWAPKPYRTETISMDFKNGGRWYYSMVSPENERHYCLAEYSHITPEKSYQALDAFTDAEGNINMQFPRSQWTNIFVDLGEQTRVNITIQYDSLEHLEQIISLGFKEGFSMAIGNLDQYIQEQFKLRAAMKTTMKPRVSTYLNFPGNTEEAFEFYRTVFQSQFTEPGIQRFGDLPANGDHPPVSDALKKMVLHVELPITGHHILMGTDAPKEMGFDIKIGNNMHIQIEPSSREEADRIFNALSAEGTISMPMADMFWGSYFGSFTDKFGINWMINYLQK